MSGTDVLTDADVRAAAGRIAGMVRPVTVAPTGPDGVGTAGEVVLALEYLQLTGSFKARGAANFLLAHRDAGTLPAAGVTIASGGNAGLACAWAAREVGTSATVFVPTTAPAVKVDRLRTLGADVRLVGREYAEALVACHGFATDSGALASHAYDHPLIAAGAGTLVPEIADQVDGLDTVVVSVGGGGLFSGVAAAAAARGIRVVAVEPRGSSALHAALAAGGPVDVAVDSVAGDSLGARRASAMAVDLARAGDVVPVLVDDADIVATRRMLWETRRIAVEHGAATALAGLLTAGGYRPRDDERVAVVLCGANTDPATLR
ncbi:threonine dehydratase [Nakamurella flavida]|nr:serine/threonine dehydratase [Nakamurella flavida]MDP9777941.1 threonine dehydratase [Nakamurella flavida]